MSSQTKVLHLVEHLFQGGIERLLEQLARHTPADSQRLFFYTYHTKELAGIGKELERHGLPVFCYDKAPGYDLHLLANLIRLVEKEKIAVVHTHDFGPMEYAVALKLRFPRLRLVHTHHSLHDFLLHRRYVLFFQFASLFYAHIIGVSPYVTDTLRARCPVSRAKLLTIYNGLDVESFRARRAPVSERLRLVNISRISAEKNLIHLLRACQRLKQAGIPFELHHAGSGAPEEEKAIQDFIRTQQLSNEVTLHGFQSDVRPILAKGDIFVSPSLTEGHPVAVLEAMAAGLLGVCSDIPAHRLLSQDSLLFFSLTDDSLFTTLQRLSGQIQAYRPLVDRAQQEVSLRFSLRRMIQEYGNAYA